MPRRQETVDAAFVVGHNRLDGRGNGVERREEGEVRYLLSLRREDSRRIYGNRRFKPDGEEHHLFPRQSLCYREGVERTV